LIEKLILGCAYWGSRISPPVAMKLLDLYVESGGRHVDSATNYPINGNINDFGLANKIIAQWLKSNTNIALDVFVKIGSIDNSGGPECDLTYRKLSRDVRKLRNIFENNLGGVGIHWDNRGELSKSEITETTDFMRALHQQNFRIGLSGLKYKDTYLRSAPDLANCWEIQVKETTTKQDVRNDYLRFYPEAKYIAYGIGSERHSTKKDFQPPTDLETSKQGSDYYNLINELLTNRRIDKVLIGPRTLNQLDQTINNTKSYSRHEPI
jgi:hypothetical protein